LFKAIDKSENCKTGTNTFATGAGDALIAIWMRINSQSKAHLASSKGK